MRKDEGEEMKEESVYKGNNDGDRSDGHDMVVLKKTREI